VPLSVQTVSGTWFEVRLLCIIVQLISLLGLVGLYMRQAGKTGVLGLVTFLMIFFGFALLFAFEWSKTVIWLVFA
jgi:hypothetical protein